MKQVDQAFFSTASSVHLHFDCCPKTIKLQKKNVALQDTLSPWALELLLILSSTLAVLLQQTLEVTRVPKFVFICC